MLRFSVMPEHQSVFFPKGDVHLLKNVALILTRPRWHESENEDLSVFTS